MVLIIDLDLQQVVTGFGSKNPISGISVKSQDTPTMALYFTKGGVNYSLGSSPGVRFGLFETGNPNPLIQSISFTQTTDAQNRTCYVGYPNFNTVPLAAAIGSNPQLSCIGEIRYQTSFGTIARTTDIPFTVVRSLLNETILDSTQVAFTVPAVGSNVTIAISHTSWLSAGLNLTIGNGAGAYQVVSITDTNHFVAENQGGTGNAAPATVIPSGTSVGIAPAPVIPTYPDPSIIELTTHKGVANGYAGLDANTLILGSRIPVDSQTISVLGSGKIGSSAILATVASNFTTPTTGANVSVTLNATTNLRVGSYVRIPIAGYYIVQSITSGTVAVLQNNGDPFNAAAGATITIGAVLLPAQAAAGGGSGTPGQNAYTLTTASFTVPAVGATVSVAMGTTSWLGGNGYYVFITGAGYYAVNSITDGTHAVLTNAGGTSNAPPGTVVSTNAQVAASGAPGATGASGAGLAAYDALASAFTMPAVSGTVTITIGNTAWISANQIIYIATAGYFQVSAISSATQALITNLNYPGNATAGATIASGSRVSPGGLQGPQGAGGAGLNAFTTLSANFIQPAVSASVTINVGTTAWMAVGQQIFIPGGGYYTVSSISDLTHAVVINLGTSGNATPGSTVIGNGTQNVTPAGTPGTGGNAYTTISASFTQPPVGSSVTVSMASTSWMVQNQYVFITGGGTYQVVNISDVTHAVLQNVGATGNVVSGTVVPSGNGVSPSGPSGPQGATGPTGGISDAPSDGQLYGRQSAAWAVIPSGGGGGSLTPDVGVSDFDDFIPKSPSDITFKLGWQSGVNGTTITQTAVGCTTAAGKGKGAVSITPGTTTNNRGYFFWGNSTTDGSAGLNYLTPSQGALDLRWRAWVSALDANTSNYAQRFCGLLTDNGTGVFQNGIILLYDLSVSANWQLQTLAAGVSTTHDTGIAVAGAAWQTVGFKTNAGWTSVQAYINNVSVGTPITTNIPTVTMPAVAGTKWKAGTPTGNLNLDYFWYNDSTAR